MRGTFIQVIEFTTDRPDEVKRLFNRWLYVTGGRRTVSSTTFSTVGGKPGRYVSIVEFPTADDARINNRLPETDALARRLSEICTDVTYTDLNVVTAHQAAA